MFTIFVIAVVGLLLLALMIYCLVLDDRVRAARYSEQSRQLAQLRAHARQMARQNATRGIHQYLYTVRP